jgi:hypothetical protein
MSTSTTSLLTVTTQQSSEPKECIRIVRNPISGLDEKCGRRKVRGQSECENHENHVRKYRTGFCGAGQCEGTRPKSPSGKPMKVCYFWLLCPCECHVRLSKMFDMAEEPRILMDNPEYVPHISTYWMPTFEDIQASRAEEPHVKVIKSDHEDIPDSVVREFNGNTERAPRGQLEQNVKEACDAWIKLGEPGDCTTKWVSEWIYEELGLPLPSRGAIDACWKRWAKLGFAATMSHPTQFVCYTPEGIKYGLEGLKARHKNQTKMRETAQKLGRR